MRITAPLAVLLVATLVACKADVPTNGVGGRSSQSGGPKAPAWKPDPDRPVLVPRLVAQLGHSTALTDGVVSPDGSLVLTAGLDGVAILWDVATGRELLRLVGHEGPVQALSFSPDGKQALTGGFDRSLRFWDVATGEEVRRIDSYTGFSEGEGGESSEASVTSLTYSPDGRRVLSTHERAKPILWDVETGEMARKFESFGDSVRFTTGGGLLALTHLPGETILSDLEQDVELRRFPGNFMAMEIAPDGKSVLGTIWEGEGTSVRILDTSTGQELSRFGDSENAGVERVAFSPNGKRALTVWGATPILWNTETGTEIQRFREAGVAEDFFGVSVARFSPDGSRILGVRDDKTARLWESSGDLVQSFSGDNEAVISTAFSRDGGSILIGHGSLHRFDNSGDEDPHPSENTAILWDTQRGAEAHRFPMGDALLWSTVLSSDGETLFSSSYQGPQLWDVSTGERIRLYETELNGAYVGGEVALFTGGDRQALVSGGVYTTLFDVDKEEPLRSLRSDDDRWGSNVRSLALSPDGNLLLVGGTEYYLKREPGQTENQTTGPAQIVSTDTWKVVHALKGEQGRVHATAFSLDGTRAATGCVYRTAVVWDVETGETLHTLRGHAGSVWSVAFSPDGSRLVTGGDDGLAVLWDVATGQELLRLEGHKESVNAVAFAPGGERVLTGSSDQTARLWDVETGRELARLISFRDGSWAVVDDQGRFDASNGGDVSGLHWVVGHETIELRQLKERYYEPGLLSKILGRTDEPLRDVQSLASRGVTLAPQVTILQEPDADDPTLRFRVSDRGGGIGRVAVFVNDKEIAADARPPGADPGASELEVQISLADNPVFVLGQENTVEVVPYNAEQYVAGRAIKVTVDKTSPSPSGTPQLWAVIAGVSEYQGEQLKLKYASKDAEVMADTLELAATRLLGSKDFVHITRLNDKALPATRENLDAALKELQKARWMDTVVIYLAGHALTFGGQDGDYYYLLQQAMSGDLTDPAVRESVALSSEDLKQLMTQLPARKQVLILDTCYSGQLIVDLTTERDVPSSQKRALERLKDQTGMFILAGSAADALSYEASPYGQGLLTYAMLLGMSEGVTPVVDADGLVDVFGLFRFAQERVPVFAKDIGGIQQPQLAMPRIGQSFALGRLLAEDRANIPVENPRPLVLRGSFELRDRPVDPLDLSQRMTHALRAHTVNLRSAHFVFVEAARAAGAYRVAGRYDVQGTAVTITAYLYRGSELVDEFGKSGTAGDLDTLAKAIVDHIEQLLASIQ